MTVRHTRLTDAAAVEQRLADNLVGHQLQEIEGRLAFAEADDGQWFGRPAPVDGARESSRLLSSKTVEGITVRADTADLIIIFGDGVRLEIWSNSSGYEPWTLWDESGFEVVAMGGGQLAIWDRDS